VGEREKETYMSVDATGNGVVSKEIEEVENNTGGTM
jgi:hypothetical protein